MEKNKRCCLQNKLVLCFFMSLFCSVLFSAINVQAGESKPDFEAYYSDEVGEAVKEVIESDESGVFVLLSEKEDVYGQIVMEVGFDCLGGAYYDDQGQLHILKKKLADEKKADNVDAAFDKIVEQVKNKSVKAEKLDEWVCLETCKYSYNELMKYKDIVCDSSYYSVDGVFAVGIDDSINRINVHAIKGTNLSALDTLVPGDAVNIIFYGEEGQKAELVDLESYTAYCGSAIVNDSKNGATASLSCSVVWNRSTSQPQYGYLTSGHFASNVNDVIGLVKKEGGYVQLGRVVKTRNNGSIDAALISKENSSSYPVISTSSTESGTAYKFCGGVPQVNQPVTGYGYVSGSMPGVVKETSYNNAFSDITDMVLTTMEADHGDSGGPVIAPITTDELSLTGIVKARLEILGVDLGTVYVKFNNIMDEWDLNALQ